MLWVQVTILQSRRFVKAKLRIENEGRVFSILNFQLTETLLSGMLPVVLFTIGGGGGGVACA
jgi:hypothetical protein